MIKNQEVIICEKEVRGNGQDIPYRRIIEIFDKYGNLIADSDPHYITIGQLLKFFQTGTTFTKDVTIEDLEQHFCRKHKL